MVNRLALHYISLSRQQIMLIKFGYVGTQEYHKLTNSMNVAYHYICEQLDIKKV